MSAPSATARARIVAAVAVALVVAAVVALYHRVLPLGGEPSARLIWDSVDFSYPYVVFISRCLHGGIWPSWNPYEFGGAPFWGNLQSLLFHPPTLLAAALFDVTLERFQVLQVLQVAIGAVGMFLWGRVRTRSTVAALVGAVLFAGGGTVVNFFSHYGLLSLYCLLPWPFAMFERWERTRRLRWLLCTTVAIACWLVTSYPSQLGYYIVAFVVYWLVRRARRLRAWRVERALFARELLLLGVVAPLLALVHLAPAFALVSIISRGHGIPIDTLRLLAGHSSQLFSLALGPIASVTSDLKWPDITLRDYSVGVLGLFAALYALTRPTRGRWLLAAAALACCDLMMSRSLLLPLVYRLSFLTRNSYYPTVEFGSLLSFILLTLAMDGVAELTSAPSPPVHRFVLALAGVLALLVAFPLVGEPHFAAARLTAQQWHERTLLPGLAIVTLLTAAWVARRWLGRGGAACAMILVVVAAATDSFVDVRDNVRVLYADAKTGEFAAQAAALRARTVGYLDLRPHVRRGDSYPQPTHAPLLEGWRSDWGYDATVPTLDERAVASPVMRAVLLDPRPAFVADEVRVVDDPASVPLLAGARVVAAFARGSATSALPTVEHAPPASVEVSAYSIDRIRYRIDTPAPCVVVFNEPALPGWRARIDGVSQPILAASGTFRALVVPAGAHRCDFRYSPPGAVVGIAGSIAGIALLVLIGLDARRRRRASAAR